VKVAKKPDPFLNRTLAAGASLPPQSSLRVP